jgi:class 3 adenylate cyclase
MTRPRLSLGQKYGLVMAALAAALLFVASIVQTWFTYRDTERTLLAIEQQTAAGAAFAIDGFLDRIVTQLGWTTFTPATAPGTTLAQREADLHELLLREPAIMDARFLDAGGRERLFVSRIELDVSDGGGDRSADPAFVGTRDNARYFGPVTFRDGSEPHMSVALREPGPNGGVIVADLNLKLIRDVETSIKVGATGFAYIVDASGRLIAHPDPALLLRDTDMSGLLQVRAARTTKAQPLGLGQTNQALVAQDLGGRGVLSAWAPVAGTGWTVFVEEPLSEAFQPIYGLVARSAVLLAVALGAAAGASVLVARGLVRPIQVLQKASARIGAGDLEYRIELHTGDELEALAEDFNTMTGNLRDFYATLEQRVQDRTAELEMERTRTQELLHVILPPEVAEELERTKGVQPRKFDNVAILFCDIVGFTSSCDGREPTEIVATLQQIVEAYEDVAITYGLQKIKTIGDCFMAAAGLLEPVDNPVQACLRCGVEMVQVMQEIEPAWNVRVGINVGSVVAGILGHRQYQYDLWGDAVNTASRMESNGIPGCITMSRAARDMVASLCDCESLGQVHVKGKGDVEIFKFTGWRS